MPFTNPIVGGTTLVRSAIQSRDYVPGVSGWAIKADGSAEFANITVGGSVNSQIIIKFVDGSSQRIYGGNYTFHNASTSTVAGTWLALTPPSHAGSTYQAGTIGARLAPGGGFQPGVTIASPWDSQLASDWTSQIDMYARGFAGGSAEIDISAERITMNVTQSGQGFQTIELHGTEQTFDGNIAITPASPGTVTITPGGGAVKGSNQFNGVPLYNGFAVNNNIVVGHWTPIGTGAFAPFVNGFKDRNLGGSFPPPAYYVDAFGNVYLRGQITGGAASVVGATILTLPTGLQPELTMILPVSANGGTEVYGRIDVNFNGVLTWRGPTVVTGGVNWFAINVQFLAQF